MRADFSTSPPEVSLLPPPETGSDEERGSREVIHKSCFQRWTCNIADTSFNRYCLGAVVIVGVLVISAISLCLPLVHRSISAAQPSPIKGLTTTQPKNITACSPATNHMKSVAITPASNCTTESTGNTITPPILSYENKQSYPIPDLGSATSTINVTRTGDTGSVNATVDIKHGDKADLIIKLYNPCGNNKLLHDEEGVGADLHETFTEDMSGCDSAGKWTLRVDDVFKEHSGTLKSWQLDFQPPRSE